jgi:hypothetical protein
MPRLRTSSMPFSVPEPEPGSSPGSRSGCVFRPRHRPSQVGCDQRSVGWVPDQNRVGFGKCYEGGHRSRAGSDEMFAVVARHDHQFETAVLAVGSGGPVRVHDFDATRFLARSRHDSSVENSAWRQRRQHTELRPGRNHPLVWLSFPTRSLGLPRGSTGAFVRGLSPAPRGAFPLLAWIAPTGSNQEGGERAARTHRQRG